MPPPEVIGLDFDEFLEWFGDRWLPGQHVAIIGPTGSAKTTILCGILRRKKFVLGFDPKGGSKTLASTGYPRLTKWPPPRRVYDDMAEGKPARFLVGPIVKVRADLDRLKAIEAAALDGAFEQGGWTVAIDEFQILSDRRMMNLGTQVEALLIAAREKGVSVVTLFQAPRWVPRAATDQASWVFVALSQDDDVVKRLAEILGRDQAEIRGAIKGLAARKFAWLCCAQDPTVPLVVTVTKPVRLPTTRDGSRVRGKVAP